MDRKDISMHIKNLYLIGPISSWNYRFPGKYQESCNIIIIILARTR
jgi:hypothetical protein